MIREDEAVWLIKSSGRIIGPHTIAEVSQLLRDREVTVIDEISMPSRRWVLIRDHVGLQSLIQQLRSQGANLDDMVTSTGSITGSVTETAGATADSDEITEDISEFQSQMREIVYDQVSEQTTNSSKAGSASRYQSAASLNQQHIRLQAERGSRWMWALTVVVLVAVTVALGTKRFLLSRSQAGNLPLDQTGIALMSYQIGDYQAALDGLKKVYVSDSSRKEIWFPLALLMVQLNGQTVEAKRLLNKVKEEKTESNATFLNARGILRFSDGDQSGAIEDFKQAMIVDSTYLPALVNDGVLALVRKDYRHAHESLEKAIRDGFREGIVAVQFAQTLIFEWKESGNRVFLLDAEKVLRQQMKLSMNYQQELRLATVYVALQRGQNDELEGLVRQVLDVDTQQVDDFRQPLTVMRQLGDWAHLVDWCKQVREALPDSASASALEGVCLLKKGQAIAAKTAIEKAINQAPKDPLLQAVFASVLKKLAMEGEASVALGRAVELDRKNEYVMPSILQARFCSEREDLECASTYWMKVLEASPKHPAAQVGLAQVYMGKQAKSEAQKLLLEVDPENQNYKPYQRLRRQIGGSG